ncbi:MULTISPECIES: mechanosensitive ion channel family protein [unclassified Leeuwenhoekiella]|uniref:mechanosensitive ion channel family protein n=1 Tax=unclassified Leeuwenhoekiella TaxID=2615029 RepID=UPI000C6BAF12|nr:MULTISPECIES: mechanosensitive ion channel [unclassified Leeuwenhoekiella]MAW97059.1 mechanosensitive ion channel protein MscS [Leeuwenhoekiella sp.]MBA80660.1 mechanosensitive ion channel protein MscS [Leeuwenhoekiella sp.]|tara:strand:- start:6146 stop:7027 length:882 start_codon:yes stop_codon:yes gene_type:complete
MIDYLKQVLETWESSIITYFPKIFLAIVVLIVFWFLAKMGKKIGLNLYSESKKAHYHIANFIASLIYFFLILSGLFIALKIVGLEQMLSHLLAGAGVIGIIAGFAFKDIASNIFAGLLLNIQRPFRKDDWVQINDSFGVVLEVGWITTSIKTVPGQEVFVPNQLIYNSSYTNFSRFSKRRIILESGVSYGDDLEHVRAVALDEVKKVESLLPHEDVDFYYTGIGSSTYNFQLRFWIAFKTNNDFMKAMSDIIIQIKKRFEEEDICIAYDVTTLDFGVKGGVNLFDKELNVKAK